MDNLRVTLAPEKLAEATDENLYSLLDDIQKASTNLFNEAWRRGLHKELAAKGMEMKQGPVQ